MPSSDDFIYFSSMQELANWRPESANALNISNTPLLPRPYHAPTPKINNLITCHDYKGGYVPSEAAQGQFFPPGTPALPEYTSEYLHLTRAFIYFSHHRVSVPPAAWINVCHRAGVRVLGTFLVEGNDGVAEAGRLFEKGSEGEYLYATQLTRLAETYGFDGWLMNVESQFPAGWSVNQLQVFLRELNAGLGIDKELIWYDAVTVLNKVHYQNGLTLLNAPFLAATSGLFANYFWRTPQIAATRRMAGVMGRSASVYMGVDCYGRGSWGDGGFGVVVALGEIVNYGLSAALFAPGWTWENFEGKRFYEIEKLFWAGVETTVAVMPLGSSESFYTNFNRGFGDGLWLRGKKLTDARWVHLGAQSLLPNFKTPELAQTGPSWSFDGAKAFTGAWSLKFDIIPAPETQYTPLFKLGVKYVPDLVLQYVFTASASLGASGGAGLYWDFTTDAGTVRRSEPFDGPCSGWKSGSVLAADEDDDNNVDSGSVLVEVGVYAHAGTTTELWLGELKITTLEVDDLPRSKLSSVVASAEGGDVRLAWNVYASLSEWAPGRSMGLWSEQTKDFAYFVVWKGEEVRGVAYACVFVATAAEEEGEGRTVGWRVDGVTWDGEVVKGSDGVH